jgi:hypothetical protein
MARTQSEWCRMLVARSLIDAYQRTRPQVSALESLLMVSAGLLDQNTTWGC